MNKPLDKTMTAREFAESPFCELALIEKSGKWGLIPAQLIALTKDDQIEVNALLVSSTEECFDRCMHYMATPGTKLILMALDFPAILDIPHDFLAIYRITEVPVKEISLIAVPYNAETGERCEIIEQSEALTVLRSQMMRYVLTKFKDMLNESEPLVDKIMRERSNRN